MLNRGVKLLESNHAYVYVFQDILVTKYYKIGLTKNPEARLHKIQKGLPFKFLKVHCIIPTQAPAILEKFLHDKFYERRKLNEWFDLNSDDLAYIEDLAVKANLIINDKKVTDNR